MTDRIDLHLQGDLPRDALTTDERQQVDAVTRAVDETRAFVDTRPGPDVTDAVMRRIAALGRRSSASHGSVVRRFAMTLWTPREVTVRPAYAIGAVAVVTALVFAVSQRVPVRSLDGASSSSGTTNAHIFVQFRLETDASRVQLAGSFTNWEPRYELREAAPRVWTITLPLTEGVHDYAFVVDGDRWVADPFALQITDGFGGVNSRLTLLAPETGL